jgi:hypothetical protein
MSMAHASRRVVCPTPVGRFMGRVEKTSDCWLWTGGKTKNGYGSFYPKKGPSKYAHRWLYALVRGPIPEGMQLDHLCRVRHCVNPDHLEPVTMQENLRRGPTPWRCDRCGRMISPFALRCANHMPLAVAS